MSTTKNTIKRKTIRYSDPGKILNLVMSLTEDSCAKLQVHLNAYLCEECDADVVFQILVHTEKLEASIEAIGTHVLPKKFKLNANQKIDNILKNNTETVELLSNFDSAVLNILTTYIPEGISKKRIVILPISHKPFSVIFCVVAPKILEHQVPQLLNECALFTWPTIKKAIALEYESILKVKCQMLLRVSKKLFTQVSSLDTLLQYVIEQAKHLVKAEYCNVMLIDTDTMELMDTKDKRRFPINKGITGEVLKTGSLINVKDLRDQPSFDSNIDNIAEANCRNFLCFPIREQSGIIGVGQLINKIGDPFFDAMDEEIVLAFSIYCGVCVIHSIVFQKVQEAHIRNALANELILYHMKKGYRDVPYHNWMHAFSVSQWAYAALDNFQLMSQGYFTDLQGLMYLLAALMHDLDHRGVTNSYHIQGKITLAALYSSEGSVMERHHLAQALCILNTEGCDILESLPRGDYDRALIYLRDYILATDLSNYFKNQNEYKVIAMDFQKGNRLHTNTLRCLLMNCADLSDHLKDWASVKKTSALALMEFFKQENAEKSGEPPTPVMDREQCFIPTLAIEFLQSTCIPIYETLAKILPKAESFIQIIQNHIQQWDASKPVFAEVPTSSGMAVLLSNQLDTLIEQNIKEKERAELERLAAKQTADQEEDPS